MSRPKQIALWAASILLGALFCMAGFPKIGAGAQVVEQFANWGYPSWFAIVIGVVEVAGGISLFIPRAARFGAPLLMATMLGATVTHVRASEWPNVGFTVALLIVLFLIFRARSSSAGSRSTHDVGS